MKKMFVRGFCASGIALLLLTGCSKEIGLPSTEKDVLSELNYAPPGGNQGNITVSGGGTALELGEKSTFTFNAVMKKDGSVSGKLIYHIRVFDISVRVDIICLKVSGNSATMSGPITKLFGPGAETSGISEGQSTIFTVVDNGEGNAASPDMFSDLFIETGGGTFNCLTQFATPYIPLSGNISIK